MATNTYVALDKVTVGTAVSSVTLSSINQGYTDLVLVCSTSGTRAASDDSFNLRFNADTTTNYSDTALRGNGTSATSFRDTSSTGIFIGQTIANSSTSFTPIQLNIMNYANATTNKTILSRNSYAGGYVEAAVGLWRKTPEAITSITLYYGTGNITAGSTFSLYGIAAEGVSPAAKATGGAIYSDDTYYYHVFGSTGTFTPLSSLTADVLVVAGGGGAGSNYSAGGGAGGLLTFASEALTTSAYTVTIGAGGTGAAAGVTSAGTNGSNSQFGSLTLCVGGGTGMYSGGGHLGGSTGGSGGGGTDNTAGFAGTSGQGYAGGTGGASNGAGGGGGGAGGNGGTGGANGNTNTATGGTGGVGFYNAITDAIGAATSTGQLVSGHYYYGGGGAGGSFTIATNYTAGGNGGGGAGGWGNSSNPNQTNATAGTANTGGGGGGAGGYTANGAAGGSGIVIVRYLKV